MRVIPLVKKLFERDESAVALRFGRWGFWWTLLATVASFAFALAVGVGMVAVLYAAGLDSNDRWNAIRYENASVFLGNPYSLHGFISVGILGICATFVAARIQGMPGHGFLTLYGGFSWSRFWRSGTVWIVAGLPFIALSVLIYGEAQVWSFAALHFPLFVVTTLAWIAIQTFAEEALFRGYLYHAWVRVFPYPALVAVLWSAVFAAMHWINPDVQRDPIPAMISLFTFALFAQWLTVRTGSLDAAWGMHFTNNVFATFAINVIPGYDTDAALLQYVDSVLFKGGGYATDPISYLMLALSFVLVFWAVLDRRSPFFIKPRPSHSGREGSGSL